MTPTESIANKVLIVDDDSGFQRLVEAALGALGLPCVAVRSGEEALKLCAAAAPRLAIVDGLLPGVRGDEVCLRLRRLFPKERLPILFVSAFFRDAKSRGHLIQTCQVDLILHKPLTADDLKRAVGRFPSLATPLTPEDGPASELPPSELVDAFLALCEERVSSMRACLQALQGANRAEAIKRLKMEAHRFKGGGGSYGFSELSRLGGRLDALLGTAVADISASHRAVLTGLVEAIALKVAEGRSQAPAPAEHTAGPVRTLLVDLDGPLARACRESVKGGAPCDVAADLASALESAAKRPPEVVAVAADQPALDGATVAAKLAEGLKVPVVVLGRSGAIEDRLQLVARGVRGYLPRPSSAESLQRMLADYARPRLGARVLAVDPDRGFLSELAQALAAHRLDVEPCPDPRGLFEALDRFAPLLLLMRVAAKPVDGFQLLQALRGDWKRRRLPVLALTADPATRAKALDLGADDAVCPPCAQAELASRAQTLVQRFVREERLTYRDPFTGAYRLLYLREALDRALLLARRGRPLAVLAFELQLHNFRSAYGPLSADAAVIELAARLRDAFRDSDVVARVEEGLFMVLLNDVTCENAQRLLRTQLKALAQATVPAWDGFLRGGLSTFPENSGDADALIGAAEESLAPPRG